MPYAAIASAGLQGLGSAMSGGGERKLTPEEIERLRRRLFYAKYGFGKLKGMEQEITGGVDMGEITRGTGMMTRSIMPGIKSILTRVASRFGVRSPQTAGNIQSAATKAMSEKMGGLYNMALQDRFGRRRQYYSTQAALAGM